MGELGGTAQSIISVGGYTTKNTFTNTNGEELGVNDVIGDYYLRSSRGPTLDGRIKPDISAPANLIASAENSFFMAFDPLLEAGKIEKGGSGHWSFGIRRGTSAAAPLVAGIVALMLEAKADLTPESTKDILIAHAVRDGYTGSLPNQLWGHGKVNAYGAIASMEQITSTDFAPVIEAINIFPNPTNGPFVIDSDLVGPVQISILDYTGRPVFERKYFKEGNALSLELPEHLNGIFFLRLKHKERSFQRKLIILD